MLVVSVNEVLNHARVISVLYARKRRFIDRVDVPFENIKGNVPADVNAEQNKKRSQEYKNIAFMIIIDAVEVFCKSN